MKLITTQDYLLGVDESEIKEGDFLYSVNNKLVVRANKSSADTINSKSFSEVIYEKIIAHLPLNNSPILQGVPLLPPLEDDVEKLAVQFAGERYDNRWFAIDAYKKGYNKAKSKYKYTEEDIRKAIAMGYDWCHQKQIPTDWMVDNFIQSQRKMPVAFECEIHLKFKPKTTTNAQGQTVLVGTYKY